LCYLSGLAYVENAMLFFGMAATACLFKTDAAGQAEHPAHSRARLRWTLRAGAMAGFACACKYTALILIAMPLSVATLILPARSTAQAILRAVIFTAATVAAFSPWMLKNQIMTGNPLFPLANTAFDASPEGWGPDCTKLWERSHSPSLADATIRGKLWSLGNRIAGDHYQRFGPLVLLLPFVGLLRRPRDRVDAALLVILLIQTAAWCFLTHLYARFAVALLIPLVLLCGRSVQVGLSARRAGLIAGALVIGTAWNFFFAVKLHRAESPEGAPASWFYDGELPGYEYFKAVNQELPEDSKFLMIGDARAFYFKRPVDYCVVFNRNPFVEAIRSSATDADVYGWLHGRGYTHLLVNWGEVNRLRDTYGFPPEIAPVLFEKLQAAGLSVSREFPHPTRKGRYVTLYSMN